MRLHVAAFVDDAVLLFLSFVDALTPSTPLPANLLPYYNSGLSNHVHAPNRCAVNKNTTIKQGEGGEKSSKGEIFVKLVFSFS